MSPPLSTIEFIARGLLVERARVLLCQNVKKGYWYLPGGHVDFGEGSAAALQREFLEETGIRVRVGEPVFVNEGCFKRKRRLSHELNIVFPVERSAKSRGKPVRSLEPHVAFKWFKRAELRSLDFRPAAIANWLRSTDWNAKHSTIIWRSDC